MTDRQNFFRMFRYVKPYAFLYVLGTLIYSAQVMAFPLINSVFIGGVTESIVAANFSGVIDALLLGFAMFVVAGVSVGIGAYLYIITTSNATRDIRIDVFRAFMKTNVENPKHSGEGVAAINTDVARATDILDDALTPFLQNVIGATFATIAVAIIDWRMGIGALLIGLIAFFIQSRFAAPLAKLGKVQLETNADSVKSISNIFAGALTIRAFNRQDRSLIQFDRENGKLKGIAFKQALIGMWQNLFTTVQGWLTTVVVFAFGGWLAVQGEISLAQIMMILPFAEAISSSMSQIGSTYAGLQPPIVAAKRVYAIIDSAAALPTGAKQMTSVCHEAGYTIDIKNLNFAYKNAPENALQDIKLSINENEMVAFVGESGSGKSTLLRAIIGMYERDTLNMEIGGTGFSAKDIHTWRSHFAYVDQSCKLFDMNISENIAMGKQGNASESEIQEAAKRAFAHDFIAELPEKYETPCGEKGASLSGGQKQRIAIARALVRKAPILVFDEATAALDTESERNIMETIESLRADHTILMTTHNLANIEKADKIVVMDKGRIGEIGTHRELLAKGGLYTKLLEDTANAI
ncbi:MAG: ABC transporter ATP-binding protein/permease [Defluviitaleaceae bacterium]|nr:ABC transporter ATP-binding protein/permease [Defluviitaleaceae bacterium]